MTAKGMARALALGAGLGGCSRLPLALDPAGPAADSIVSLFWIFTVLSAAVWLLVVLGLLAALMPKRESNDIPPLERGRRREGTALRTITVLVIATGIILVGLTAMSFFTGRSLANLAGEPPMVIAVTGNQWWWAVRYDSGDPSKILTTANEIHVPVGKPIRLKLASNDVIHSFWIPQIAGKQDLITGRINQLDFVASKPGTFRGQCAEFCGFQHAHMRLVLIAESPEKFDAWFTHQLAPAFPPTGKEAEAGQAVFLKRPCVMCHSIAGTPAGGKVAPDLTHVASRLGIAANTLPMTRGALAAWIADPQSVKPGAHMPRMALSADDLNALVAYLEQLK